MSRLPTFERVHIRSHEELANALECVRAAGWLTSLDTETTGLDPRTSRIRLTQVASATLRTTFIIDCFQIDNLLPLREYLLDPRQAKICYNGKFDTEHFIHHLDAYIETPVDLLLGAQLLRRYEKPRGIADAKLMAFLKDQMVVQGTMTLQNVLYLFTGIRVSKEHQRSNWAGELSEAQYDYAATDVECLLPLADSICEEIEREGLGEAFAVENGVMMVTAGLHYYGILADPRRASVLKLEIEEKRARIQSNISQYPEFRAKQQNVWAQMDGGYTTINLDSDEQVRQALERRWKVAVESVRAAELKKHYQRDPDLVELITDYNSLGSMLSSTVEGILKFISPDTGRVHSEFDQNGSPQQRYKSRKPILLNIPKKSKYGPKVMNKESIMYSENSFRDMFVPAEGCYFCKADYSQLQLLGIAQESGDPVLLKACKEGLDLHKITARFIFDLPENSEIEDDDPKRHLAKTTNYAVSFLCSKDTLQRTFRKDLGVEKTIDECGTFIERYMKRYRGVAAYHRSQPIKVARECKVAVRGGRATLLRPGHEPRDITTESINFVMALLEQSGIKKALARLGRVFWRLSHELDCVIRIVLSPYDEILVEVDKRYADRIANLLEQEMIRSMGDYIYKVPVKAESKVVASWGGAQIEEEDLTNITAARHSEPNGERKIMFEEAV